MGKYTRIVIVGILLSGLLVSGVALAMESANYRLDWFTPLTGGGGGAASSASYAVNFTVGQSATGTSYDGCLGFWCGDGAAIAPSPGNYDIYLPLVLR